MTLRLPHLALALLLTAGPVMFAQQPAAGSQPGRGPDNKGHDNRGRGDQRGPDDYHIMPEGMPNIWWHIPGIAQSIGLSAEQQKRMDDILAQNRNQLIQLGHELHSQRDQLKPLLDASVPDTARILPQLDHVAQARAALEVAFAKMLLNIRTVLTPDQWNKLQAENKRWQAAHAQSHPGDNSSGDHNFQGKPGGSPQP